MENRTYHQIIALFGLLTFTLLGGCAPTETPPTAAPIVADLTPTPTAMFVVPASTSPPATPISAPTPAPATPSPTALAREGDTLPSLSPVASPTPGAPVALFVVPCVTGPGKLPLQSDPGSSFATVKTLAAGTPFLAFKTYADAELWLQVQTQGQEMGWVNANDVTCQGDLSRLPLAEGSAPAPFASPSPTASPTLASPTPRLSPTPALPTFTPPPPATPTLPPPSPANWRGEYYDNPNLAGQPVLVRDDPALDFNWGGGSPGPGVPTDNFSARWTRSFQFEDGDYRFLADVDDGVKLYLDGWLVIDEWNTNPYVLHSGVFADIKAGPHTLTVEFFEAAGDAHLKVWFEKTLVSGNKWVGEYYNNPDFRDAAVLVREDEDIDFDWDNDEPAPGMNDDFSVRWQRTVNLEAGDYEFTVRLAEEDRVKVFLDNWLILEEDSDHGGTVSAIFKDVGAGAHTLRVEYQDFSDDASIEVNWSRD